MQLQVKYFDPTLPKLRYVDGKSDWIDLCAAETIRMKQGDYRLIPLGVAIALPKGYEAHLLPRSSTFAKYGIIQTNAMGIIDESYSGDTDQWLFPAYALRDTVIPAFERICQFRIMAHQEALQFCEVTTLGAQNRGGFGSTGTK